MGESDPGGVGEEEQGIAGELSQADVTPDEPSESGTSFGVSLGPGKGSVSATGSTAADISIGFSDGKGGPGENFSEFGGITDSDGNAIGKEAQSPSEFSTAMDTIGIDQALNDAIASSPTAGVNQGITSAGISPAFSDDVFDPATMTDRSGRTAPSAIEQAAISYDAIPASLGFLPADVTKDTLPSITGKTDTTQKSGLAAVADTIAQNKDKAAAAGIDFGVTAPVDPDAVAAAGMPGTAATSIDPTADAIAAMSMPGTAASIDPTTVAPSDFTGLMSTRDPAGITAGVSPAPPGFEEKVGKDFDPSKMAQMEAIMAQPNVMPGVFGIVEDKTKDALATSIALGRNVTPMEALFGYTAPNMAKDKETIEEFNARTGRSIPPDQIVTDAQGVVIGLKDKSGNLVTGRDPNAPEIDESSETQAKKKAPKKPDDPCPEGYKLIDGKCTIIEDPNEGTGFIRFPLGKNPPFQTGPFQPKSTPTPIVGIRGLNPITFNNPFRR
tara:strand:- start:185 stop:1678 length:1494 start_codon:yes stop_codon:yes gene_type:complete